MSNETPKPTAEWISSGIGGNRPFDHPMFGAGKVETPPAPANDKAATPVVEAPVTGDES